MTSPARANEILAMVITESAIDSRTLPAALCQICARELPMTGAAVVLQSTAGLDRVVAATEGWR